MMGVKERLRFQSACGRSAGVLSVGETGTRPACRTQSRCGQQQRRRLGARGLLSF
jgi:hypothetical protein